MNEFRNIAIIAHVDHGKTTLTDALLRQTGAAKEGMTMDSNALEQERGITIYSKNTSLIYKGVKINIVDTPGHADFGSEVERVLRSIDTVLLVVDAQEGPMPQTRFVLKKSLELGMKPIVIINKIDKSAARPDQVHEEVLELFMELGANDEQLNFTTVYAIGRDGIAKKSLTDDSNDLTPLLDTIIEEVPPASSDVNAPFQMQAFNLAYDNFLGRMAIGRIFKGRAKPGMTVYVKEEGKETVAGKITKLFTFTGTKREGAEEVSAGDIAMIAGIPSIYIGETITDSPNDNPLPSIKIDEPTISLEFIVNDSPFAGREGKFVTGRQIRERLEKELEVNVGLKVDFSDDTCMVYGRGELHIAVLLENMRREGYELQISEPKVIIKDIDGRKHEPFEEVIVDIKEEYSGNIISTLSERKAILTDTKEHNGNIRLIFEAPTRALLGYRNQFVIETKGEGILSSRFLEFKEYKGEIKRQQYGSMISMEAGKAVAYALNNLQERGFLYVEAGEEIYVGMVIGNITKGIDLTVNPIKGKQLTNMRQKGSDGLVMLTPPWRLTIERGMEVISSDEYLEITPKSVRLRKKHLTENERVKASRT
ncbi:MAG: GTP-binding protein TypA [Candidatus Taylorbacteria bacterium RIFCSPLOWO2_12_FULL_43_20]|uniref:50S ribosomal subunit assembly factor BipA n=1 Tax=Candidatus Taylorbacteria bacterium RIFCSPLOWO2_12_FULL_43_20 TaxID=1802332 RepID=A0A1G2P3E8_9BACT|nr:MAG: GTP-binding protein TypA [Candidatus Taylorbacteria bacterium RIFCSPHIGHO2_01_FULL_43_120]OHA22331.1 MAG: GTP-binding protein TypA [Candidatus Taylorbacteria bacterium RIFCSPHIGHO2_02_FULL_43_55]OHA30058.1 MAG: GTP-binding protein TypA [Candidatus Taylorbacteria bacterium RIFCSPHIGHO2_12_FULL_42_34]OHA32454.1 MAG: GTP-binding protein TypA [Candidatus Taylorbacteria bacterium RIFCSPLOWO2_01_FULL_43_83]OHA39539.1 MAG: GTP-binding protein TypA [Candidatus Taylorbacteria bacterium RIFCSPLOW